DAGMSVAQFADFLFGACLLDWDAEARKMRRIADRFDAASEVRIVGAGTDLTLGVEGRRCEVDDGHINMPGGEVFTSPIENATEGGRLRPRRRDPRVDEYARLLVGRSVAVQPGWQVLVRSSTLARPLVEAVVEEIARAGAYPLLQLSYEVVGGPFAREAPVE